MNELAAGNGRDKRWQMDQVVDKLCGGAGTRDGD